MHFRNSLIDLSFVDRLLRCNYENVCHALLHGNCDQIALILRRFDLMELFDVDAVEDSLYEGNLAWWGDV